MKCNICGSEVLEGAQNCQVCGTPVNTANTEQTIYDQNGNPVTPPVDQNEKRNKAFALTSLIVSIASIILCCNIAGIASLILGIFGLKSSEKTMAIIGIVISAISLLIGLIAFAIFIIGIFTINFSEFSNDYSNKFPEIQDYLGTFLN